MIRSQMYAFMNPQAKLEELLRACMKALNQGYTAICVPQWFVAAAKEALTDTKMKVATIAGLPGGTTSSPAKYAEIKQAVANGAEVIILPVNMEFCKNGDLAAARNDFSSAIIAGRLSGETKTKVIALIDAAELEVEALEKIAGMCMEEKASSVMLMNAAAEKKEQLSAKFLVESYEN